MELGRMAFYKNNYAVILLLARPYAEAKGGAVY
jgi:hypothetical protein